MNATTVPARQAARPQPVVQTPSSQALGQLLANNPLLPRIHLAMLFPRDADAFPEILREAVLRSPAGMVYKKPQGKDRILGPSIRMAEVAAAKYRNLWTSNPTIDERDNRVTVTVEVLDLESNVSAPGTATTSLVGADKRRMREDIVSNLVTATVSKAKRNAIIAIIGRVHFDELVGPCMKAEADRAAGELQREKSDGKSGEKWSRCVAAWAGRGVSEKDLLQSCRVAAAAEVGPEHFADLAAAWTSVVKENVPARVALGLVANDSEDPSPSAIDEFFGETEGTEQ